MQQQQHATSDTRVATFPKVTANLPKMSHHALPYWAPLPASSQGKNAIELVAVPGWQNEQDNRQVLLKINWQLLLSCPWVYPTCSLPLHSSKPVNEVTGRQAAPLHLSRSNKSSFPDKGFHHNEADNFYFQSLSSGTWRHVAWHTSADVSNELAAHFYKTTRRHSWTTGPSLSKRKNL